MPTLNLKSRCRHCDCLLPHEPHESWCPKSDAKEPHRGLRRDMAAIITANAGGHRKIRREKRPDGRWLLGLRPRGA